MRKLALLCVAVAMTVLSWAQRAVTGRVTDEKGTPIPNASITIKGTTAGTVSGEDGFFTLTVPANGKVLVFSAVGMAAQEVTVGNKTAFNINLQNENKSLQEVVVVGYGVQQKKAFTGSASKVEVDKFSNLITPSVDKQLGGRAPGVQVTTAGGLVNAPARIRIRGTNSINQNNDPLIVVDGVPIITGNLALTTNSNALGDINPSDIASMEVLKDGSATAIYGSRAAAGVILITTKRGAAGKAKVSYEGYVGFSSVAKKFDLLNADQFVMISNEKFANVSALPKAGVNPGGVNTDWQDEVFVKNAAAHSHTLSLQGGGAKTSYYFSMNYSDQKGIVFTNYNKAYRGRFNLDHEINKFVKVGNSLTLSRQVDGDQNNGANSLGGAVASTIRLLPNVSPYDTSSINKSGYNIAYYATGANSWLLGPNSQAVDDNWQNVMFTLNNNNFKSDKYRILDVVYAELSLAKGLKFRSQFSADYFNDYSYQSWDPRHGDGGGATNGLVYNGAQNRLRTVWQNYFNYNKTIDKHSFYLTGGHEVQQDNVKQFSAQGTNVSDMFFIKEGVITGGAATQSITGNVTESGFESLFGRINYDFANKYFAQASIRRDGQSSLAEDKRYGTFPGFSVGWRVSEEGFWKGSVLDKINELKLKASYAKVGNALGGWPYLSTFGVANYGNIGGIAPTRVGNPGLQWETSKKIDVGLDASFANSRYNFSVDVFRNDIDNLVLDVPTPLSTGVPGSAIAQNIGTSRNDGIELSLGGDVVRRGNFTWNISANYTKVRNEIVSLYSLNGVPVTEIPNGNYNLIRVGDPINIIYGYRYAGVNSANGNPMYYNKNGDLVQHNISTNSYHLSKSMNDPTLGASSPLSVADKVNLGQGVPTYFGAVINNFTYKGFGLEVMVRYSGGNKVYNWTRQEALMSQSFHNNSTEILNRWTKPGQVTNVPKLYYGQGNIINQTGLAISRFVEDGDFAKLQNVVLSYELDSKVAQRVSNGYITGARFYLQGQNLYTWSKYRGADPENISSAGLDQAVSPQVRTISAGVNIGF